MFAFPAATFWCVGVYVSVFACFRSDEGTKSNKLVFSTEHLNKTKKKRSTTSIMMNSRNPLQRSNVTRVHVRVLLFAGGVCRATK